MGIFNVMAKDRSTVSDYRTFFSTDSGQRVLANMLTEGKFFTVCHTPEEQAVQNFLKIILSKIGSYPSEAMSTKERIDSFVRIVLRPDEKSRSFVKKLFRMKMEY